MRNRRSYRGAALLAVLALLITGCDLYDLESQPSTALSPEVALDDITGYEALMNSVYNRVQHQSMFGQRYLLAPDVLADNVYMQEGPSGRYVGESTNNTGAHIPLNATYNNSYRLINEANHVIADVHEASGATEAIATRLRGEAYFMRALAYHGLIRTYAYEPGREVNGWNQGVIIRTTPTKDITDVEFTSRNTNAEVYNQIENDVLEAISLLSQGDRGVYYANYAAAHALAARNYLYWERWEEAAHHATEAMEASGVGLASASQMQSNIYDMMPNPESLFELDYDPQNESLGVNQAPSAILTPARWYDVLPAPELLALYQESDLRNHLFTENDDNFEFSIYSLKYTESGGSGTYADNVPIFRYPEMLLIRAEAHAELDDLDSARDDLHVLQEARGMAPADVNSKNEIIAEIMDERRRELVFEGHRFYDLKRRAMDIPKPDHTPYADISYTDIRILAPLPTGEVDNNPQLENNPGY